MGAECEAGERQGMHTPAQYRIAGHGGNSVQCRQFQPFLEQDDPAYQNVQCIYRLESSQSTCRSLSSETHLRECKDINAWWSLPHSSQQQNL